MKRKTTSDELVAAMVKEARAHVPEELVTPAVLSALTALRGQIKWTPGMVSQVQAAARTAAAIALALVMAGAGWSATRVCESGLTSGVNARPASGTIEIHATVPFTSPSGASVETNRTTISVVNGAWCANVEPNAEDSSYAAVVQLVGAERREEVWVVPMTGVTLTRSDVRVRFPVPASASDVWALPQELRRGGATTGQALTWNGGSWVPSTVAGPKGDKGDTGATGPQGAQGPVGPGGMGYYLSGLIAGPDSTKTVAGSVHGLAGLPMWVVAYDGSTSPREAIEVGWTVNAVTSDVVVTFAAPQSSYYLGIMGPAGGVLHLSTLTNGQLASMNNSQLAAMVN